MFAFNLNKNKAANDDQENVLDEWFHHHAGVNPRLVSYARDLVDRSPATKG